MSLASAAQLAARLNGFLVDESGEPEAASATLQSRINLQITKIENVWRKFYYAGGRYPFPSVPSDPLSLVDILLRLLAIETPLTDMIRVRSPNEYGVFYRQSKMARAIAEQRFSIFSTGGLHNAIKAHLIGDPLPTEALANISDLARDTSGLTITDHTKPNLTTAGEILAEESCWVRALAARSRTYTQDLSIATQLAKDTYKDLVIGMAAPQIQRINQSVEYTAEIDAMIKDALDFAWKQSRIFATGGLLHNFKG